MKFIIAILILIGGAAMAATNGLQSDYQTDNLWPSQNGSFQIVQGNSILPTSPLPALKVVKRLPVVVTGYSSSPEETDEDPFTTAAGTQVKDGTVANNLLDFGTKVRFPDLYGDKIFVVEDRMSNKKGYYHFDIWFPSKEEALNFGTKNTYVEIMGES